MWLVDFKSFLHSEQFKRDVEVSFLLFDCSSGSRGFFHLYNSELSNIRDKHAPLKSLMVIIFPLLLHGSQTR